ncbi:hypothetical protein V1509DRAFT_559373 [Lipomyces kononenkoae]
MPVAHTHTRNNLLWNGVLDVSQLDPMVSSLKDLQIWGFSESTPTSYKTTGTSVLYRGAIGTTKVSTEYEKVFATDGLRLSAVTYIDVSSVRLWMVSGPAMHIFTTNAVTESFFRSVVASSRSEDASTLSRGIIVKLLPPDRNISTLLIFGNISPSLVSTMTTVDTDISSHPAEVDSSSALKVTIKAIPLNTSCRIRSYLRYKRKRTSQVPAIRMDAKSSDQWADQVHDNMDGVFLDASVEEVASTQKRNERLDQLLRRRTLIKRKPPSAWYTPAGSLAHYDSRRTLDSQHKAAENSLLEEQLSSSHQISQPVCLVPSVPPAHQSSQHYTSNGMSSTSTLKTALTLQRVLLSALRLRGISRSLPLPQAASILGEGSNPEADSDYQELFQNTYQATLFALRNRTSRRNTSRGCSEDTQEIHAELFTDSGWEVRRMQRVVDRILDIFLEADVEVSPST